MRRAGIGLAGIALALAVLVLGVRALLPGLLQDAILSAARTAGLSQVRLRVAEAGFFGAVIEEVRLGAPETGPGLAVARIGIAYSPLGLLRGRITQVSLEEPRLALALGSDGGLDMGPLAALVPALVSGEGMSQEVAGGTRPLSIGRVQVRGGQAQLHMQGGPLVLTVEGGLGPDTGGTFGFTLSGPLEGGGRVDLALGGERSGGEAEGAGSGPAGARLQVRISALTLKADLDRLSGAFPAGAANAGRRAVSGAASRAVLSNAEMALRVEAGGIAARLAGDAVLSLAGGPVARAETRLVLAGALVRESGQLEIRLGECVPVRVEARAPDGLRLDPVPLCPAGDAPLAVLALGEGWAGTPPSGQLRARVGGFGFALAGLARGEAPATDLSVMLGGPVPMVTARFSGGGVEVPGVQAAAGGLDARLTLRLGAAAQPGEAGKLVINALKLRDLAVPDRFAPAVVSASLSLDGFAGEITGPATLATPTGRVLVRAELTHDAARQAGQARVTAGPLEFSPGGLQPQALLPVLAGHVTEVAGQVDLSGRVAWTAQGITASSGILKLSGLGFHTLAAQFAGIDGKIDLAALWPPATRGAQTLRVGRVDPGIPLLDGEVRFEIARGAEIIIHHARWPFAGGALVASSAALRLGDDVHRAVLDAVRLDLGLFLGLLDVAGLSGSGMLSGRVPVEVRDGDVYVRGAVLEAEPGGVIRYRGGAGQAAADAAAGASQGADIAFRALEDFHFRVLRVEVDGPVDGDMTARIVLEGANPAVYEGYPVHLNIRTEGPFGVFLRRATIGLRALDVVTGREAEGGVVIEREDAP